MRKPHQPRFVRLGSEQADALFVLVAGRAAVAKGPPDDEDVRARIDRLLEQSSLARNPHELRARFGREALAELAPLLARSPANPELHHLAALGWIAAADERG